MKDFMKRIIPMWLWVLTIVIFIIAFASKAMAQQARPTFNPFNNGMMHNGFQNNGFNNGFQNNGFNNGFQNNGFNNGFQNNGFNNFQQQNNNFQQQGNNQTNKPQLFTRRYHLNNGYLFGRPTLYFDAKSGKMQPWVRKNLR